MPEIESPQISGDDVAMVRKSPDSLTGSSSSRHDEGRGSRNPTPIQTGHPQSNTMQSPAMVNSNRPSSVASNHSNASTSAATSRTTATSRRGGRIRSRSPPTMISRTGATNTDRDFAVGDSFPSGGDGRNGLSSPNNPSSAAAAAAAAAAALSTSNRGGNPSPWYDHDASGHRERRGDNSRYHPGYDNIFAGSRSWPGEVDPEERHGYGPPTSRDGDSGNRHSRGAPHRGPGNDGHDESFFHPGGPRYEQPESYGRGPDYDRARYGDSGHGGTFDRESGRNARSSDRLSPAAHLGPYSADQHYHYGTRRDGRGEYFTAPQPMAPGTREGYSSPMEGTRDLSTPATLRRSGGTSRVIGTPTPIHVPRAVDLPSSRYPSQAGTPASVFRGRPPDVRAPGPDVDDNSPQKILLSFRTPTTSFEELPEGHQSSKNRKSSRQGHAGQPLSPEEPPQIQHSHHQHQMDQTLFFEPQRSPKNHAGHGATLEMAPSFSLFNQSFDSLGDSAQYLTGPLDATFQSNSFGPVPSGSGDNDSGTPLLPASIQRNLSSGGGQFLGGSSSGGMLTFGMSPVNSFGNGPPNHRRGGNMMVLGGTDIRSASPTQMLGMYPSYSGGYGSHPPAQASFMSRSGHQGETHVRGLSSGSFGGAIAQIYTRSFEGSPTIGYHSHINQELSHSQEGLDGPPTFYAFLKRNKGAFIKCSFLLPGLKAALLESPLADSKRSVDGESSGGKQSGDSTSFSSGNKRGQKISSLPDPALSRRSRYPDPSPQDSAVAMRRIASAICAFGGSITGDRAQLPREKGDGSNTNQSIFREKDGGMKPATATVTPSSSTGTPPGSRLHSRAKVKYDELLPSRYYENENRLSWEFEESPPVGSVTDDEDEGSGEKAPRNQSRQVKMDDDDDDDDEDEDDRLHSGSSPLPDQSKSGSYHDSDKKLSSPSPSGADQPKMRYRCKLCGLPKQNHTCAYQQSLQRSIGVMVYPAVNAFTSNEPGLLAPALSEMNNFVSGSESVSSAETSPARPTPDRSRHMAQSSSMPGAQGPPNVTPETIRSSAQSSSPGTLSLSTTGGTPQRTPFRTPSSGKRKSRGQHGSSNFNLSGGAAMSQRVAAATPPVGHGGSRKRHHSQQSGGSDDQSTDLLFVDAIDLKPEQFRIITPSKVTSLPDAYTYPALPLPYAQRKRLSDNLFALSKEVPLLTDECAVVLREARERDMWDLAVAELMTQVVVVIHCHEGDTRLEGLRQYLLTLGIAC